MNKPLKHVVVNQPSYKAPGSTGYWPSKAPSSN